MAKVQNASVTIEVETDDAEYRVVIRFKADDYELPEAFAERVKQKVKSVIEGGD